MARSCTSTRLYLLVSGLTLIFGSIDLLPASALMLKYEAVISNLLPPPPVA